MTVMKQGARAKCLGVPLSSLSNYWTGRRVPSAATLRTMYDAVCLGSRATPVRLEELERLRRAAARRNANLGSPHESSDVRAPGQMRFSDSSPSSTIAPSSTTTRSGPVPAQGPARDRRSSVSGKVGETVGALLAAQAAGNRRGVIGIAWSASKALTHGELSAAAADLYASQHSALGEALLLAGRERRHEDTMQLAITLIRADLTAQADLVLCAALPRRGIRLA
ncbi:hypothetical protein [Streptomyces goshikiensis]|uniref:hypothetical protein n=1 Tax=Streptomyces goshikiensis TaxID=1942 RepID=UPI003692CF78